MSEESARDHMARMFNMGDYGKQLADDILRSYGEQIAQFLEFIGRPEAATDVREFNSCDFE